MFLFLLFFLPYFFGIILLFTGNIETKVRLKTLADTSEFIIAVEEAKYFENDDTSQLFFIFFLRGKSYTWSEIASVVKIQFTF